MARRPGVKRGNRARPRNPDLHGNAPDSSPIALVIVDMINDLEFPGGRELLRYAQPAAERIARLSERARAARVPVIYANDNFGRWRSDFRDVVEHCLRDGVRGKSIGERLRPQAEDYFVLKPKHSAFFATTLELLLEYLGTQRLILTGISGDDCILRTACDAHLRELGLTVPADCVASISARENRAALDYMARVLDAETTASPRIDFVRPRRKA